MNPIKDFTQPETHDPKEPFPDKALMYKVIESGISGYDPWAKLLVYVKPVALVDRLDLVDPKWEDEYEHKGDIWHCRIRINDTTREGVSYKSHYEAFYRACTKHGIGRYLYHLPSPTWANFYPNDNVPSAEYLEFEVEGKQERYYWYGPRLPMWALCEKEKDARRKQTRNLTKKEQEEKKNG